MSFHSVLIQKLLNANAHIGRHVTAHHFKIFSEGTRNSVSIIDSDKTLICLRNACNFIGQLARADARFLFVNTNPIFDEIINQMTKTVAVKNDNTWRLGGFLTNSLSPKKFRGRNKKLNLNAIVPPDCIVIFDTERKSSVIQEAYKLQIPIVGLVDSSMPWETFKKITYPVPANDSVEFVYLFCNLITKTILKEKEEAMAEKADGLIGAGEDAQQDKIVVKDMDKILAFPYEKLPAIPEVVSETKQLLDKLVVLKVNASMGTELGFHGPKCAMEIGGGLTCLDLIINHIEELNANYGCNIPLILVNAISIHDNILKVLKKHPNKNIHSVIKSEPSEEGTSNVMGRSAKRRNKQDGLNTNLVEVFLPLIKSRKLEVLLSEGKEYILMLSSDNVAHVIDPKILYHLIQNEIDYCLEVMPKPSESEELEPSLRNDDTQTPTPKENWRFVDTMWMSISSIANLLGRNVVAGEEELTVSELFENFALSVPKSRYLPVDTTSDLFLLQSDLYNFTDGVLTRNPARKDPADPSVQFGPEFLTVDDLRMRFKSIPSILELNNLEVAGDVYFGTGVTLKGEVTIRALRGVKIVIPDNTVLENKYILSQRDIEEGSL